MPLDRKGSHGTPYIKNPQVQDKPSGVPFQPTPSNLSRPHGHTRINPKGQGNTRRGPH